MKRIDNLISSTKLDSTGVDFFHGFGGSKHNFSSFHSNSLRNAISITGGSISTAEVITSGEEANKLKGFLLLSFCVITSILASCSMKMQALQKDNRWYMIVYISYFLCFSTFPTVLHYLPLGLAYAVWCGVGIAGTTYISYRYFGEEVSTVKLLCLLLVVIGIVGLSVLKEGQ